MVQVFEMSIADVKISSEILMRTVGGTKKRGKQFHNKTGPVKRECVGYRYEAKSVSGVISFVHNPEMSRTKSFRPLK